MGRAGLLVSAVVRVAAALIGSLRLGLRRYDVRQRSDGFSLRCVDYRNRLRLGVLLIA
jgi:hypothetical protein